MSMQVAVLEDKFINAQLCNSHVKLPENWFTNSTGANSADFQGHITQTPT